MARMNNQVRSLQIIAKQNGWDPNELMGDLHSYPEDRVHTGDSRKIPEQYFERSAANGQDRMQQPELDPYMESHKTTGADPYVGMPGAKPTRK